MKCTSFIPLQCTMTLDSTLQYTLYSFWNGFIVLYRIIQKHHILYWLETELHSIWCSCWMTLNSSPVSRTKIWTLKRSDFYFVRPIYRTINSIIAFVVRIFWTFFRSKNPCHDTTHDTKSGSKIMFGIFFVRFRAWFFQSSFAKSAFIFWLIVSATSCCLSRMVCW